MIFLLLFALPVVVAFGGFLLAKRITLKELGVQLAAEALVVGIAALIVSHANTTDVETWNGRVASKRQEWTSCEHSYPCNCHTDSCGKDCTTTTCDTCYDHANDWNWTVTTTNQEKIRIRRVDRQGVREPPRWTSVTIGEPTAIAHDYTNYVKAAPGTLFKKQGLSAKYAAVLPLYPEVHDYYREDRVITAGVELKRHKAWNEAIAAVNADVGAAKQANVILVLVKDQPEDYALALEEAWTGGKKNDVVLVVGLTSEDQPPAWAYVMAWTDAALFKVRLRSDILAAGPLDLDRTMAILRADVGELFVRKPMADFQYLESSITPTPLQWVVAMLVSLAVSVGLTWFFYANDTFDEDGPRARSWRLG